MKLKYNQLTVVDEIIKNKRRMFVVECDCGNISTKRKDHVIKGRAKSCKSCASKKTALRFPPPINRTGSGNLSGTHYLSIKHGAKRRNIDFLLSAEELWKMFESQSGLCALTGLPIILTTEIKNNNVDWDIITASLDRKDGRKAYTLDNVWWVHKVVNRLKNNYSVEELLYWCNLIVDNDKLKT